MISLAFLDFEFFKLIIDNGLDLSSKDNNGMTILHRFASANNLEKVNYLIEKGADINILDDNGHTPFFDGYSIQ